MATPKWYARGILGVGAGNFDLDTTTAGTYKLMLVTGTYTPDQQVHDFRDDLGANEASGGSGYPAGGFSLTSVTWAQPGSTGLTINWDAADISQAITGGPFAFRYGVYYRARGGVASADDLIGYVDFGSQSVTDATINITNTNQLTITAS